MRMSVSWRGLRFSRLGPAKHSDAAQIRSSKVEHDLMKQRLDRDEWSQDVVSFGKFGESIESCPVIKFAHSATHFTCWNRPISPQSNGREIGGYTSPFDIDVSGRHTTLRIG
ncbi:hypothetical protein Mapa_016822 [Marchantia paleacea]|nr:hypothetical protein Mapa_016822 [Marchantia paleacea]